MADYRRASLRRNVHAGKATDRMPPALFFDLRHSNGNRRW